MRGYRKTAHRVISIAVQVFDYAIRTNRTINNHAHVISHALLPVVERNMAAIKNPKDVGRLLLDIDRYSGNYTTLCALKLSPLIFLRPDELHSLRWEHVDFERAQIRLPIEHIKRRLTVKLARPGELAYIVPLSRQAIEILRDLNKINNDSLFVFPNMRKRNDRCISNATVLNALRAMGYDKETMTEHGFRALASMNLHELFYPPHIIEKQLSYTNQNKIRAAYNHAEYLDELTDMIQSCADWIDQQKLNAEQEEQRK